MALEPHEDGSEFSFVLALNGRAEYEGGGTQVCPQPPPVCSARPRSAERTSAISAGGRRLSRSAQPPRNAPLNHPRISLRLRLLLLLLLGGLVLERRLTGCGAQFFFAPVPDPVFRPALGHATLFSGKNRHQGA